MDKKLQESVFSQRYRDLPYSREWIRNGSASVSWWVRKKVGDVGLSMVHLLGNGAESWPLQFSRLRVPFMEFVLMWSWAFSGGVTVPVEGNCRVFAFGVLASQTPMWLTSQHSRGDLWCIMFCLLFKTMYANFWRCFVCSPMKKFSIYESYL